MKYPILLITVILSLSQFHLSGQILKQLPGKWSINNVLMKPEMDTVSQTAMAFLAGKNSFKQFTANNRFIEFEKEPDNFNTFIQKTEENLRNKNVYYDDLIRGNILQTLQVRRVRKNGFIDYMRKTWRTKQSAQAE